MKQISLFLLLSLVALTAAFSQQQSQPKMALNVYGGYVFPDHVSLGNYYNYNNYGYIEGNGQYGAGLEFFVDPHRSIELSYQYMSTKTKFYNYQGQTNSNDDNSTIQYIMIGGNNYVPTHNEHIQPYGGFALGVGITNFNYYEGNSASATKFAWNLHLGVKVKTEGAISLKFQAILQSIAQGVGVGVGFGTGGASAGVTTYSSVLQFGLQAALCIALGGRK
jgi:hypothetical protein